MANNSDILAGINELIDKVESLCGCLSVNINMPEINVPSCGGGGDPGYKLEDPPFSHGDQPPVGYELDPSIDSRKCKAANYFYDQLRSALVKLDSIDFDLLADVAVGGSAGVIVAFLGAFVLTGAWFAVAGAAIGMVTALVIGGFSLTNIIAAMDSGHSNLVCALYNAQSTTQAKDDFITELQNQGITIPEALSFMGFFLVSDALKILFHAIPGSEAALSGYTSTVDCAVSCGGCQNIWIFKGNQSGNSITAEFQPSVSLYQIEAFFNYDGGQHCGGNVVIDVTVTSGTAYWEAGSEKTFRCRNQSGNQIYNSHTPPAGVSCGQIYFWSTTTFTIDLITT